jgi:endonuclease/exonuclease/phosphatase family metal-dependent hydrolase
MNILLFSLNTAQLWWPLGPDARNARAKAVKNYITKTHPETQADDVDVVVCLQEVWRTRAFEILVVIARKLGLDYHWYPKAGLLTMVPHHDDNQFIDVPFHETIDYPGTHKGFTIAVNHETGRLIVNTHLQAGICKCARRLFYRNTNFDDLKVRQLTQLTAAVENVYDASTNVLCVAGDFNLWSDKEDEYEAVRKLMEGRLELQDADHDNDDRHTVDYLWTSEKVEQFYSDDGNTMSDHPILWVRLIVR